MVWSTLYKENGGLESHSAGTHVMIEIQTILTLKGLAGSPNSLNCQKVL
jgi:hypothetical protein